MIATMDDLVRLEFDSRCDEAFLSKEEIDRTEAAQRLEREVKAKEMKLQREIALQAKRLQDSGARMKEAIAAQAEELKREGVRINSEYRKMTEDLERSTQDLAVQEVQLSHRCKSLQTYNQSLKESMRRLTEELERELEEFEHRLEVIRKNPRAVDVQLVNMSMILGQKSALIKNAIGSMRHEIASLTPWFREN
jgi:chromosome segregation ATPase